MSFSADPRSEQYEDDDWTRRRGVKVAAAAVFVIVVGAVLVVSLALALRPEKSAVTASGSGSATDSVQGIGPPPGSELGPYLDNRRGALGAAAGERVAVVSLQRYTTEARARQTTGSAQVLALLAAMPGGGPSVVGDDLASWLNEQQDATRNERDEIQKLIPTSGNDPEFKAFYEQEVERLNQVLETVRPDSQLVFAVVVRAPVTQLRELADDPEVRMVDIGPSPSADSKTDYRGVRPEETVRANDPPTRPV